jgi:hypothetical protein
MVPTDPGSSKRLWCGTGDQAATAIGSESELGFRQRGGGTGTGATDQGEEGGREREGWADLRMGDGGGWVGEVGDGWAAGKG